MVRITTMGTEFGVALTLAGEYRAYYVTTGIIVVKSNDSERQLHSDCTGNAIVVLLNVAFSYDEVVISDMVVVVGQCQSHWQQHVRTSGMHCGIAAA